MHFSIRNVSIVIACAALLVYCKLKPQVEQSDKLPLGKLFIIGGGVRSEALMQRLIEEADLQSGDFAFVLPQASFEPDTSFHYTVQPIKHLTPAKFIKFDPSPDADIFQAQKDSLLQTKLIYICGGDQSVFMHFVDSTGLREVLLQAYSQGATIAGTSAGAAMMSEVMITGDQNYREDYESTFSQLLNGNLITARGLGFLQNTIIDQHFVARSRYNRALSAINDYPEHQVIGIEESTALLIKEGRGIVVGDHQILVFDRPKMTRASRKFSLQEVRIRIFEDGEEIEIREGVSN